MYIKNILKNKQNNKSKKNKQTPKQNRQTRGRGLQGYNDRHPPPPKKIKKFKLKERINAHSLSFKLFFLFFPQIMIYGNKSIYKLKIKENINIPYNIMDILG